MQQQVLDIILRKANIIASIKNRDVLHGLLEKFCRQNFVRVGTIQIFQTCQML